MFLRGREATPATVSSPPPHFVGMKRMFRLLQVEGVREDKWDAYCR